MDRQDSVDALIYCTVLSISNCEGIPGRQWDKPDATRAEGLYGTVAIRVREYRHRLVDLLCYNRARTVAAAQAVVDARQFGLQKPLVCPGATPYAQSKNPNSDLWQFLWDRFAKVFVTGLAHRNPLSESRRLE